jgi:hypothetical protein
MLFRVLDAGTPEGLAAWTDLWSAWPGREVMAHPEYARLFARPCDRVVCAAGRDDAGSILFPLVLRPLAAEPWAVRDERRWDATTPYGYGGPFAWGGAGRDDAGFWRAHADWCREENLVSTFARLSLFPEDLAAIPGPVEVRSPNVVIELGRPLDAVVRGYEHKVLRWANTAEANGLEVQLDRQGTRLDEFLGIYRNTMERHHAAPEYFFPRDFFTAIVERLPGHFAWFHAIWKGEVVSSDLALFSGQHLYYFLSGTLEKAFPVGANYLLKHRVVLWAHAAGMRACVLGGGYDTGDGLFRYKRGFARRGEVPFKVACLVHDEQAYAELLALRTAGETRAGRRWAPRPGFFPGYRG